MRESCKKLNLVSLRKIIKIVDSIHSEAFTKCFRSRAVELFKIIKFLKIL